MESSFYLDRQPSPFRRVLDAVATVRDWIDERGRIGWIVAVILGFMIAPPLGLLLLVYTIWSKRMFGTCCNRSHRKNHRGRSFAPTGNTAFDAYRDETLKRLQQEHEEFLTFLAKLREAKDKAEFDQFMAQRRDGPAGGDLPEPRAN